jgi:hypothetical protein
LEQKVMDMEIYGLMRDTVWRIVGFSVMSKMEKNFTICARNAIA